MISFHQSNIISFIKITVNPESAQGWVINDDGGCLYCKEGKALTGRQEIDGREYYFSDTGILQTGKDGDD